MTFGEFRTEIKNAVESRLSENQVVDYHYVKKNNNIELTGLIIKDECNISPTIYIEPYYNKVLAFELTIDEAADEILSVYDKNRVNDDVDMSFFKEYSIVKSMLFLKLINYEQNSELLKEVPYRKFLDLAMVPYCLLSDDSYSNASITIHKSHMKLWDIEADELINDAIKNTRSKMEAVITDIRKVLENICSGESVSESLNLDSDDFEGNMYVVTNGIKLNGAICMTDIDSISKFAKEKGTDFYVLPSSIHEILLVPTKNSDDIKTMSDMVKEVNHTQVSPEEILSDHAYYFAMNGGYVEAL